MSRSIQFILILLTLCGCMVGPDYVPPDTQAPGQFHEVTASLEAAEPEIKWWTRLNDDELTQLIESAIKQNHDLRIAETSVRAARAFLNEGELERFPIVPINGSVTRERRSADSASVGTGSTETFYDASFDATWELDFFGRVRRRIEALEADYGAAKAAWREVFVIVTAEVARNYIELRGAQHRLDVANRNADNQKQTYELTLALLEGGRGTDLDISRAQAQYETTLATIPPLEAEVIQAIHRLSVLVGKPPHTLREKLLISKSLPTIPSDLNVGNPETLLKRRPDIQTAERLLASATAQIGVETADLFPRITLLGSYGSLSTSSSTFGDSDNETFRLGPSFTWSAFDLGRVRARIRAADATVEGQLALYERTVITALEETENAFSNFIRALSRKERLIVAANASEQAADLAQLRYQNGVDSFINVLDAESRLLSAQDELARSTISSGVAFVALYKALGGGWQDRE